MTQQQSLLDAEQWRGITSGLDSLRSFQPRSAGQLRQYLQIFLGLSVPCKRMCAGPCQSDGLFVARVQL